MSDSTSAPARHLRPKERVIKRLHDAGHSEADIAWRFRASPGHIERTLKLIDLPAAQTREQPASSVARALERTVIKARAAGASYAEIAARLRRSPGFVCRVERMAGLRADR